MTRDLHTIVAKVSLAIEIEDARAVELSAMADQATASQVAALLRGMARERRIRSLDLQSRLAGLMAAIDEARE